MIACLGDQNMKKSPKTIEFPKPDAGSSWGTIETVAVPVLHPKTKRRGILIFKPKGGKRRIIWSRRVNRSTADAHRETS